MAKIKGLSLTERFFNKVEIIPFHDCWIWVGGTNNQGYGTMGVDNRTWLAHRVSYLIHRGYPDDRLFACHTCDNPICVNPNHLYLGTPRDNHRDMVERGRAPTLKRAKPPRHKGIRGDMYWNSKPLICITNGRKFGSTGQAAEEMGLTQRNISSACRLTRHSAGKHYFRYLSDFEPRGRLFRVFGPAFDCGKEYSPERAVREKFSGIIFRSIRDAARKTGVGHMTVRRHCHGKTKKPNKGLHFEWA